MSLTDALSGVKLDVIEWTPQMEFNDLRRTLLQKPVLRAPDFEHPFIIEQTDASILSVGAVLGQSFEDWEKPVAPFSRKLNPARSR